MALKGDKTAEDRLFKHLRERFTLIAGLYISKEDAKEIAQDTCMAVFESYKSLSTPYKYNAWAHKILKNKIANYYKKRSLEKENIIKEDSQDIQNIYANDSADHEIIMTLRSCLKKLKATFPRYAEVILLSHEGFSTEEICLRLKISRNNLYVLLNRGRKILRDCIFDGESK